MNNISAIFEITVVIVLLLSFIVLLVMTSKMKSDIPSDQSTGHSWDGIEELNQPLPKWWYYTFIILVIWAIGFCFAYPALGNYPGLLGWTAENQYDAEVQKTNSKYDEYYKVLTKGSVEEMATNSNVVDTGRRLFLNNCAVCHGSDAAGTIGYPNLTDHDWLYGGTGEKIVQTITNGRDGLMPPQGGAVKAIAKANGIDESEAINDTADYVLTLSGLAQTTPQAESGKKIFDSICAACHLPTGKGNQALGSANLTDNIWLYADSDDDVDTIKEVIVHSIEEGHKGHMPAHKELFGADKIKVLAAYVYSLSLDQTESN